MTHRHQDDDDTELLARIREELDGLPLPNGVAERLARARRVAVASLSAVPRAPSRWVPIGALATTLFAVAMVIVATDTSRLPIVEDDRALAAAQDVELLEDLEFLAWLDEESHAS